tara:strand:- start:3012 stop:3233 length:222 start_codon:yes stop_codon:yes gene_type:complete
MRSCLDRLKPFIRKNLEESKDIYPHSYKEFIEELSVKVAITDIRFGTLTSLTSYTNGELLLTINDLYDMFEKD